jgi:hypothetical protein
MADRAGADEGSTLDWVDEAADRFEKTWQNGTPPLIADFIKDAPDHRRHDLLRELVKVDLHYRWKAGSRPSPEDYLRQFPGLADSDPAFSEELAEHARKVRARYGDQPTLTLPPEPPPAAPGEPAPAIGRYVVVGQIGEGAQSTVHRAVHPLLGRDVLIKLSRHAVPPDGPVRSRLLAEGRILAELEHPHLARVYDLDFHGDRPFLVMELVRGRNLEQYASQERPAPRRAAALVAQVARALTLPHRRRNPSRYQAEEHPGGRGRPTPCH